MAIVDMLPQPGGSSEETLTVLWENDDPTTSFSNGKRTLDTPMLGFKRIRIEYAVSTTATESTDYNYGIIEVPIEYITRNLNASGHVNIGLNSWYTSSGTDQYFSRAFYIPSANQETLDAVYFLHCFRVNAASTADTRCIPLKIYGIK